MTPDPDLLEECDTFIAEHRAKANTNEFRARLGTGLLLVATAAIPVLIVVSTQTGEFAFGKLLPAVLAAVGAVVAGFLQLERPHERWSLYRRYQRLFEVERLLYSKGMDPYAGTDRDLRFSKWLVHQRLAVHDEWAGLVPSSGAVASEATKP